MLLCVRLSKSHGWQQCFCQEAAVFQFFFLYPLPCWHTKWLCPHISTFLRPASSVVPSRDDLWRAQPARKLFGCCGPSPPSSSEESRHSWVSSTCKAANMGPVKLTDITRRKTSNRTNRTTTNTAISETTGRLTLQLPHKKNFLGYSVTYNACLKPKQKMSYPPWWRSSFWGHWSFSKTLGTTSAVFSSWSTERSLEDRACWSLRCNRATWSPPSSDARLYVFVVGAVSGLGIHVWTVWSLLAFQCLASSLPARSVDDRTSALTSWIFCKPPEVSGATGIWKPPFSGVPPKGGTKGFWEILLCRSVAPWRRQLFHFRLDAQADNCFHSTPSHPSSQRPDCTNDFLALRSLGKTSVPGFVVFWLLKNRIGGNTAGFGCSTLFGLGLFLVEIILVQFVLVQFVLFGFGRFLVQFALLYDWCL